MGTILARADHEITYGQPVYEGATIAAWRMQRLHLELLRRWEENCLRSGTGVDLDLSDALSGGKMEDEGERCVWD